MTQRLRSALQRLLRLFQPLTRRRRLNVAVQPRRVVPERPPLSSDTGDSETELRVWTCGEAPAFPSTAYLAGIRAGPGADAEWGHLCSGSREITAAWLSEMTGTPVEADPPSSAVVHARPRHPQGA